MVKTRVTSAGIVSSPGSGFIGSFTEASQQTRRASATLTAADAGLIILSASQGALTMVLPRASDAPGASFIFRSTSPSAHVLTSSQDAGNVIITQSSFSDQLNTSGSIITFPPITGSSIMLMSEGVNWFVLGRGSSAPSGNATGDLSGSYPNPTVTLARGLRETSGPTTLTMGAVADGQGLIRSGSTIVGQATASGTMTADGDLLTRATGTLARLPVGTLGQRLVVTSSGSPPLPTPAWGYVFNPAQEMVFYTDFLQSTAGTGLTFTNFALTISFTSADRWGIVQFANTTVTQGSIIGTNAAAYIGGAGASGGELYYETSFMIPELSDATDTYTVYIGFGDSTASGDHTDAISFRYTHSVAAGAWQGYTRSNGAGNETVASGGSTVTVAPSTWYKLGISINSAWSSVTFYVNGTSIGTSASNIPTGTARAFCQLIKVDRTAAPAAAARIFACDYIFFRKIVTR